MLSKAQSEDSHVKTVTLARGTLSTPTIPTSAPRSVDRSSTTGSISPDTVLRGDVSSASLASIGIVELLEQDDRPTMIIDVGDTLDYGTGPLRPLFANASLRSYHGLIDVLSGTASDEMQQADVPNSFLQFKAWLLSAVINGESLNVRLPPFMFAGISWQLSTLRRRLRVVSGSFQSGLISKQPTTTPSLHAASVRSAAPSTNASATSAASNPLAPLEEPQDYFGAAAVEADLSPTAALPTTEKPADQDASRHPARRARETRKVSPAMPIASPFPYESILSAHAAGNVDLFPSSSTAFVEGPSYDWTRLPVTNTMPEHVQFARSVDWSKTALGPIETWTPDLRQMCNLIMASPHPAAMYWGEELIAIYNEAYILLAVGTPTPLVQILIH